MPTRFDHAVIAVRDLDTALAAFQRLGFDARPGGRHDSGGTHNGLVRFGLDYFELLSVYDEAEARAKGGGQTILDGLHGREAALVGYALATDTIEEDARRFVGTGAQRYEPRAMQRTRPDGQQLTWRVYAPGENSWNRPWPFLIQWDTPDAERLRVDLPGDHPNGAVSWTSLAIAVRDLAGAIDIYQNQLGLTLLKEDTCSVQIAQRARFGLGEDIIDLLTPTGAGSVQERLDESGEGPFSLYFKVRDLQQTQDFLSERAIAFTPSPGKLYLDPRETLGVRLFFIA